MTKLSENTEKKSRTILLVSFEFAYTSDFNPKDVCIEDYDTAEGYILALAKNYDYLFRAPFGAKLEEYIRDAWTDLKVPHSDPLTWMPIYTRNTNREN